jgi:hypothetical protein
MIGEGEMQSCLRLVFGIKKQDQSGLSEFFSNPAES